MTRTGIRASAIIIQNKKILLIHRRKEGREYWVFPGGGVEEREKPEKAVKREVEEETGLPLTACRFYFEYQDEFGIKQPVFLCEVEDGEPFLNGPEKERLKENNWYQPEWVDWDKVENLTLYPLSIKEKVIKEIKALYRFL